MHDLGYIQKLDRRRSRRAFPHPNPDIKALSSDPNWKFSIPGRAG
jgi:hypothetical protein